MSEEEDPLKETRSEISGFIGDKLEETFNIGYDDGYGEGRQIMVEEVRQYWIDALRKAGYRAWKEDLSEMDAIIARTAKDFFRDLTA